MALGLVAFALANDEAESAYLDGLMAWEARRWPAALEQAERALTADPGLEEARVLAGYALLRMRRVDEGLALLDAVEPRGETGQRAHFVRDRVADRRRRDDVSFALGQGLLLASTLDVLEPRLGWTVAAQVPLAHGLAVRAEGGMPWGTRRFDTFAIGGPDVALLATAFLPVGSGLLHVDAAAGPTAWLATGSYWPEGSHLYAGLRAGLGADLRPSRRLGVRVQAGAAWFGGLQRALPIYERMADVRVMAVWYPIP